MTWYEADDTKTRRKTCSPDLDNRTGVRLCSTRNGYFARARRALVDFEVLDVVRRDLVAGVRVVRLVDVEPGFVFRAVVFEVVDLVVLGFALELGRLVVVVERLLVGREDLALVVLVVLVDRLFVGFEVFARDVLVDVVERLLVDRLLLVLVVLVLDGRRVVERDVVLAFVAMCVLLWVQGWCDCLMWWTPRS